MAYAVALFPCFGPSKELSQLGAILPHLHALDEVLTMGRDIADRFGAAKV